MGCFEDLMRFRDEVERAEKSIRIRGRKDEMRGRRRPDKEGGKSPP
ncbi:MAG: hypothetical protein KBA97_06250 [Methanothrix sp.]|mgnify:FL=1|nr:hypothetical protein [Methanothrix sp.]HUM80562.1 hypothetical protein [Methanothrix sp.]